MRTRRLVPALAIVLALPLGGNAQTPPSASDIAAYDPLFSAAASGDDALLERELARRPALDRRDAHGRSALHVAAFAANHDAMRRLVAAGADPNALENDAVHTLLRVARLLSNGRCDRDPTVATHGYLGTLGGVEVSHPVTRGLNFRI